MLLLTKTKDEGNDEEDETTSVVGPMKLVDLSSIDSDVGDGEMVIRDGMGTKMGTMVTIDVRRSEMAVMVEGWLAARSRPFFLSLTKWLGLDEDGVYIIIFMDKFVIKMFNFGS